MKITKENIKETLRSIMQEESEYQVFFRKALEKAGKSITDMSDEEKKAFFNKIDSAWDGKGEKNEELVGNQHKLDVDGDGEIEASDLAALRAGEKKEESVNESKKMFSVHPHSVGSKKFDITIYDGRKNKDGSPFIDVVTANHNLELKDKIQSYKSKGYTEVDNVGKKLGVKYKTESVNEKVSPKDLEAIKGAVESASSFMGVGSELKKLGMKYIFATSPIPIYVVQDKAGNRVGIVNKKYATKPDFVIGDTAIGVMESKVNEYSVNKKFGSKYDIGAGQFPTGTVFWNRAEDEDGDYKKLAHVADNGKITFYDKTLPSNVKKHIEDYAKTQTESVNEEEIKWNAVQNAIINFLKANTKILDKRVQAKDTDGVKGGLKSIINGLTNAQRSLKLESVNEASYVSGYTVKAKTPYEFVNGAYAVLSAYLRDEELGPKGKKELQNILKSLEYMRKYFFFKLNESVTEAKVGDFEMGDFVHFKSANKTGMVKKISGDKVTIMTMKGDFTGDIKDIQVLYQDNVNPSVNEEKYTVIDPRGNSLGTADKNQVAMAAKKKGGEKAGYFVVSAKNALKAKRALEKFKGDFKNPKLKDMMSDLYFESVNEIIKTYKPGDGEEVAKIYSGHLTGEKRLSHALTVVDVLHANNLVTKQVAQKMEQELANALARLRKSKSESVNEGRAFINAARKAKEEGKTEFEFNGKKYPVTIK